MPETVSHKKRQMLTKYAYRFFLNLSTHAQTEDHTKSLKNSKPTYTETIIPLGKV